jgi:PEGA domain
MRRVIGVVVCGFTLAACSGSASDFLKTPDFLKSSPATTALRFESVPSGAEVKVSGQTCRTPCELQLEVAELSATFALKGYQPQDVAVHPEKSLLSSPKFTPNPVHAELRRVGASASRQQLSNDAPIAATNSSGAVPAQVTTSSEPLPSRASTYGAVQ